jgi:hypothetical protein
LNKYLPILLLVILFSSCSTQNEEYSIIISNIEKNTQQHLNSYSDIIILPELGCEGCISDVENFIISNSQNLENTFVILTRIKSMKLLRLRLGEKVLNQDHIYIDQENLFESGEIHSIYPVRLILNDEGEIEDVIKKDPSNMSFFNDLQ